MMSPVRLGILGAARIVPEAILKPARKLSDVTIAAVAARDTTRAAAFARKHGIPRVHESYTRLLEARDIDAVYVPLPNSLHCEWAIRALESGKHVLCEKPLAANAAEAERMSEAAARTGRLLVEAMHFRYHPLAARMREILESGVLGSIRRIEAFACVPIVRSSDIRYRYDLAGGALMDLGCYAVNVVRFLAAAEPEVTAATARLSSPQVDRWLQAELRFANGCTAQVTCSMWSTDFLRGDVRVKGDAGTLVITNPYAPHLMHSLNLSLAGQKKTKERLRGCESSYYYQLQAFAAAVRGGPPPITGASEALANMQVIDAIYRAAGLAVRGTESRSSASPP